MPLFAKREAKTTMPCPQCGEALNIVRSCREAAMRCPHCRRDFPIKDFIAKADAAMEEFLENLYVDRI